MDIQKYTRWLFLNSLDDLEKRLGSDDPYSILGLSLLLRKLLLDETDNLLNQLNPYYLLEIRFRAVPPSPEVLRDIDKIIKKAKGARVPVVFSTIRGIEPGFIPGAAVVSMPIENFVSVPVFFTERFTFTIKDVIKFQANIMGGVHMGTPRLGKQQALFDIFEQMMRNDKSALGQLISISRIVLSALEPLRQEVKQTEARNVTALE